MSRRLADARDVLGGVAADLQRLLGECRDGEHGYITREWGFMTPGGLGGPLGGKFKPWEDALASARTFFPDPAAYAFFEASPTASRLPGAATAAQLHEALPGNLRLHEFLRDPPANSPEIVAADIAQYRDASRLFILLGSLAHLSSNSAATRAVIPEWIARPLLAVVRRLDVEPALSGHFMVVDNWQWRSASPDRRFCVDDIELLYPAFGHSHERTYHTVPACMAYALRDLPCDLVDLIIAMRDYADARLVGTAGAEPRHRLLELMHSLARALALSKAEFQRISTEPAHRTHVSKHVFIRHMQPFHKGIAIAGTDDTVSVTKGMSGLHFVSYHLLDAVVGRYHSGRLGELARMEEVDKYYPAPQRRFSACVTRLDPDAALRGFLELAGADTALRRAFNYLIECYAGEGGVLAAHSRKLFSYMHNNLQVDTSAEGSSRDSRDAPTPARNHETALRMFEVMTDAVRERRRLRMGPLFTAAKKTVTQRAGNGSFAIVEFRCTEERLRYEGSDVVRVLLPRDKASTDELQRRYFQRTEQLTPSQLAVPEGCLWGWPELFEALGWPAEGVSPEVLCAFVEEVLPMAGENGKPLFRPVSPRVYSVCGTYPDRLRVLVSRPSDGREHFGFSAMLHEGVPQAFLSCSPGRRFTLPPADSNLLMVAGGTGISPFVSLVEEIGALPGSYTLIHQTGSADAFLSSLDAWKRFTRINPGAVVLGFLSGSADVSNGAERITVSGGAVTERLRLARDSQAYYFLSEAVVERLRAVTRPGINLAYCCGGMNSTVSPLRHLLSKQGWEYEFWVQAYGGQQRLSPRARLFKAGSRLVDATQAAEAHPGGRQIIDQLLALSAPPPGAPGTVVPGAPPEFTRLFSELHPDAENLLRLVDTPSDDEFQSFANLLEREAGRGLVIEEVSPQYVAAALAYPDKLNVVRIALRLETAVLDGQLREIAAPGRGTQAATAAAIAAAASSLQNCEDLLFHLLQDDEHRDDFMRRIATAREILSSTAYVFDARTGSSAGHAATAASLTLAEQRLDDVVVLGLGGRLDAGTSAAFEARWQELANQGCGRFVLDLEGLEFISSMGLRSLLVAARRSKLVLCGMTPFVARIVGLGGISRVVAVKESRDEAVAAARDGRPAT